MYLHCHTSSLLFSAICLSCSYPVISFVHPALRSFAASPRTTSTTTCQSARIPLTDPLLLGHGFDTSAAYNDEELQVALDSLLVDSVDPDFDARHIFGSGEAKNNRQLSMLQRITATVILDYQNYRQTQDHCPSTSELLAAAESFHHKYGRTLNLQHVIQSQAPRMALAAEFKRASPSKGDIAHISAGPQAARYAAAGADIVSVLTEPRWFKGSLRDLTEIRLATTTTTTPTAAVGSSNRKTRPAILRKDFVVCEYMIAEAAAAGADTVLLIVAVLPQHLLTRLIQYSRSVGMEPLVEVHADEELQVALQAGAKVIGVNNRNLHTFQMDLSTSERVAQALQEQGLSFHHGATTDADLTLCALSGMSTAYDVDRYRQVGLGMCLIGESLMRAPDPAAAIAGLCLHPDDFSSTKARGGGGGAYTAGTQIVKICGITNAQDALVACQAGANLIGVIFAEQSKRKVSTEQARAVVEAVRKFGERDMVTTLALPLASGGTAGALSHLICTSRALAQERRPMVVGVFQNQNSTFIREMVDQCGLDLVQLHGSEGMAAANAEQCGAPAIRVVDIAVDAETSGDTSKSDDVVERILLSITNDPVAILLDTTTGKDGGGTGQAFDWSIAHRIQDAGLPVIVAGGLNVESVEMCVGMIRPFGIDVSSGVEESPGQKNPEQVREFVRRARNAAIEASKGF
jgi:indole-3-glycerol phosphate synthase/phosphoribosylanthranilate isomerase